VGYLANIIRKGWGILFLAPRERTDNTRNRKGGVDRFSKNKSKDIILGGLDLIIMGR
jgi:hypothetical protein